MLASKQAREEVEKAGVSLTDEQMAIYRASAQKRQQQKRERLHQRHQLGLAVAQQAGELLKRDFKAEKVVLFGSMFSHLSVWPQT